MKLSHISPLHTAASAICPTLRRCPGHQHPLHAAVPVPLRNIIAGASPTPSTPSEHCRRSSAIMAHRASRLEAHFTAAEGTFVLQPTAITPPQAHFRPGTNQTVLQLLKHTYSKKYLRIAQRALPRCLGECSPVKSSRIVLVFHHRKDGPAITESTGLSSREGRPCHHGKYWSPIPGSVALSYRKTLVCHTVKDGPAIPGSTGLPLRCLSKNRASTLEAHFAAAEGTFVLQPTAITPPQAHFRPGTNQTVLQLLKHTLTPYLSACPHRQHPSSAPQRRLFCLSYAFRHSKQTCFPRKKAYRPKCKNAIQRHQMAIYKLNV